MMISTGSEITAPLPLLTLDLSMTIRWEHTLATICIWNLQIRGQFTLPIEVLQVVVVAYN